MDFSRITDKCLKNGFRLNTNLSEVRGNGLIELMNSLNHYSMEISNMRIIERIMYYHPFAFKTSESIKEIMRKSDPVISAFTTMGTCDLKCNIGWLISTLNKLHEFQPLQNIVATGPPVIVVQSPASEQKINASEIITFQISTISEAQIQWWKHYNGRTEIVMDHLRVHEYSTAPISYKTKESDRGYFHIEVSCKGGFRELSQWIYVGNGEDPDEDTMKYLSLSGSNNTESSNMKMEPSIDIIPCPESDGIRRLALLIGVMNYSSPVQNLKAPETDIFDLERVLLNMGFTAYCFGDLNENQMKNVLKQFSKLCEEDNTYVFFYFAGHGSRSDMVDHLILIDKQITLNEVVEILVSKKPKVIVTIFDMCRDNNHETQDKEKILKASIPICENMILVMSTLPTHKAFERAMGYENTSLIMKPLCDSLSQHASKDSINIALTKFINKCDNIEQKPTIYGVGMNEVIGKDIVIPRIKPKIEWKEIPEDRETMNSLTIDFKIFHNFINIFINKNMKANFIKDPIIYLNNKPIDSDGNGNFQINLFQKSSRNSTYVDIEVHFFKEPANNTCKYPVKVVIPQEIIPFLQ